MTSTSTLRAAALTGALVVAHAAGCAPDAAPPNDDGTGDDETGAPEVPNPLPYLAPDDAEPVDPALNADEVGPALVDGLRSLVFADPNALITAYDALFALADDACPARETYDQGDGRVVTTWVDDCTTAGGVVFSGTAYVERRTDWQREDGSATESGFVMTANGSHFAIVSPDGRSLDVAGYFDVRAGTGALFTDSGRYLSGEAHADDVTAAGNPWLTGAVRGELGIYTYAGEGGYKGVYLEGAVSGAAAGITAVSLTQAAVELNGGCDREPGGTISLRDDNGVWQDVVFDARAPEGQEWDPDLCDGCGARWVSGQQDGTACVDGTALAEVMSWGARPW